ncbi:short-chain dehydrogenase/reductase [Sphingomonadaceae bacterium G21617-S1]|uniref:short-chain dehydrogenase/reductase n=1 Tax=Rhizorhabdus sp. TaxID=1968843 RepID=UPI0012063B67|nr:short-chain dehydrogenase/reductase [Rhizorhabdus sp.]MBD3761659.1 SDR family oxidoreductase [Rhizorhabdus sp.]MCZ4343295.1 short-chain dehydrogenase/reductase [Sphingomonadaceae bacterium G21617-S1]TAK06198.1 MAG: SDR family oxidoreductase [Rhizorhabdus sp.]
MDLELHGKTALVTGGSQGIGYATASVLANEGCDIILVARTKEELEGAAKTLGDQSGTSILPVVADLAQRGVAENLVSQFPHVDILINNAGSISPGRLSEITDEGWRTAWDLKVFGYIDMCRHFYAAMAQRGGGVIINVVGTAAHAKDPAYICGVTGNAALVAFSQSLGSDSHRDGIRVIAVNPGPVATTRRLRYEAYLEKSERERGPSLPFNRLAEPEEIGSAVAFLCSPRSAYTSGTALSIDGGLAATVAPI